jgi:pyrroloquinoline quinone biosynthesis protein D
MDTTLRPRLARKTRLQTDKITGQPTLLYPEGVMVLNPTGEAILGFCDGERSVDEVVDALAKEYEVEPAELAEDVIDYLARLQDRGVLVLDATSGDSATTNPESTPTEPTIVEPEFRSSVTEVLT